MNKLRKYSAYQNRAEKNKMNEIASTLKVGAIFMPRRENNLN